MTFDLRTSLLQDHFLYLSVQDPHAPPPSGYNKKRSTSLWTNGGRKEVRVQQREREGD